MSGDLKSTASGCLLYPFVTPLSCERYTIRESQSSKHVMREEWSTELRGLIAPGKKPAEVTQLLEEEQRGGGKKRGGHSIKEESRSGDTAD